MKGFVNVKSARIVKFDTYYTIYKMAQTLDTRTNRFELKMYDFIRNKPTSRKQTSQDPVKHRQAETWQIVHDTIWV